MNRLTGIIAVVCLAIFCSCVATKQAKSKKVKESGFMSPEIYAMMEDGNREELEAARRYVPKVH